MIVKRKKLKEQKKYLIKRILKFNNCKNCQSNNETILKSQQRFKSDYHIVYTEQINKTPLNINDNITINPCGTNAFKVCKSDMLCKYKWLTLMIMQMKGKQHNSKWSYIPHHSYRILIIGGSRSAKTNALLNSINNHPVIDKIYLYAKDPYEAKYQLLIKKRESAGLKHFNDSKAFIEHSNDMQDERTQYR